MLDNITEEGQSSIRECITKNITDNLGFKIGILTCVVVVAVLAMGCGSKENDTNDSE